MIFQLDLSHGHERRKERELDNLNFQEKSPWYVSKIPLYRYQCKNKNMLLEIFNWLWLALSHVSVIIHNFFSVNLLIDGVSNSYGIIFLNEVQLI